MNKNDFTLNRIVSKQYEHYSDYSLKLLSNTLGYSIRRITLHPYKKSFGDNSGLQPIETLLAKLELYDNNYGLLSNLEMLPHYGITQNAISEAPKFCDDIIVRFSIYPEGNGFFTPTWIRGVNNDVIIEPSGKRIDWDKMTNLTYKHTHIRSQKWIIEGMTFEKATSTINGHFKAVRDMFILWYNSGTILIDRTNMKY